MPRIQRACTGRRATPCRDSRRRLSPHGLSTCRYEDGSSSRVSTWKGCRWNTCCSCVGIVKVWVSDASGATGHFTLAVIWL